jgi:hypothetical protein
VRTSHNGLSTPDWTSGALIIPFRKYRVSLLRAYNLDTSKDSDRRKLTKANGVQYESFGAPATAREAVGEC